MLGNTSVEHTVLVSNPGFFIDENLSMKSQVSLLSLEEHKLHCKNVYLSESAAQFLVCAFIVSRIDIAFFLDYLNFYSVNFSMFKTVEPDCVRKSEHIISILLDLPWLPVLRRIKFKPLLLKGNGIFISWTCREWIAS